MGTISEKLLYLNETKRQLKELVKQIGVTITDEDSLRFYITRILHFDARARHDAFRIVGAGPSHITVLPDGTLPTENPDSIHDDEEELWPPVVWEIGEDPGKLWMYTGSDTWSIAFYDWYVAKRLFHEFTKIQETIPYRHIKSYHEQTVFQYGIKELKRILEGEESYVITDNNQILFVGEEQNKFDAVFANKAEDILDAIGSDAEWILDLEDVQDVIFSNQVAGEFRRASKKFETLPPNLEQEFSEDYEDARPIDPEWVANEVKKLLYSDGLGWPTDLQPDPVIKSPIDEVPVGYLTDSIWGTVGWVIGSDATGEWLQFYNKVQEVKSNYFDDTPAKVIELGTSVPSSYIAREFARHPEEYYFAQYHSIMGTNEIPEYSKKQPEYNNVEAAQEALFVEFNDIEYNYKQEYEEKQYSYQYMKNGSEEFPDDPFEESIQWY
jgi:cell fate (sporulation/competence/biofilm development) regulator YlbF (YheA/YmcA/DUF963 family)